MDCAACARSVQSAVAAVPGVGAAQVSFGNATLVVDGSADHGEILRAVTRAGYRARPAAAGREASDTTTPYWRRDARTRSTTSAAVLLAIAVLAAGTGVPRVVVEPLYLASMLAGGWFVALAAAGSLRRRSLDMNVLMSMAAVGAVLIGEYAEAAWVLVLFAVGTILESYALDRSRASVASLLELAPAEARVLELGIERVVPVDEVVVGMTVLVLPGERLPVDAVVLDGRSSVDQAPITGESVPVDKGPGDEVFAGTLNANGALTVEVSRSAAGSTLARIAELVEQAQGSRAPSERFIDGFSAVYTPLVFAAAVAVAIVPVLLGGSFDTWSYRALALLIVACPCSLVISVPVAVVSAIGGAARQGILIKGGQALEDLARVRAIAIDKTGTLTIGRPVLQAVLSVNGEEETALRVIASLEQRSEHPLAAALVAAASDRGLALDEPRDVQALPGRGVEGTLDAAAWWAGSPRLALERTGAVPAGVEVVERAGQTAVVLGRGSTVQAVFGIADEPRPEARAAVRRLAAMGLDDVTMLTGDREAVAAAVARRVDVPAWRSELLPEDKLRAVDELTARRGAVLMVGDGINDAPALARASVGVAMGAAGSDAALQSADVALLSDRLDRLPAAVELARRARGTMRFNVVASLLVKGLFVLLAPFGLVTLVVAVAADMGMSLLVTLVSMRLLRRPRGRQRGALEAIVSGRSDPS